MQRCVAGLVVVLVVVAVVCDEVKANHRSARQLFPQSFGPRCANSLPCISIRQCPAFLSIISNPTSEGIATIQKNHCGFDASGGPLTCCPDASDDDDSPATSRPTLSPTRPGPARPTTSSPAQPIPPRPLPPTTTTTIPTTTSQAPTGTDNRNPGPTQPFSAEELLPNVCGLSSAEQTRIFFGEESQLGAYPWIALFGYTSRFQPQVVWGCGGSLINSRYVVTASHCTAEEFTFNRDLTVIRLGEHNLTTEIDCQSRAGRRLCAPPFQSFTPVEIIRHETFNTRGTVSDDIALIRLDKEAEFNAFVGPVCLPAPTTDLATYLAGRQAFVAGWGATERGPDTQVLQQVRIPFVSRDECNPHYNNALLPEQVCFGGDGRRDSCFGDSGGPVVAPSPGGGPFQLLALVSFGQPSCGVVGVPAVYTSLAAYRQWILSHIKP